VDSESREALEDIRAELDRQNEYYYFDDSELGYPREPLSEEELERRRQREPTPIDEVFPQLAPYEPYEGQEEWDDWWLHQQAQDLVEHAEELGYEHSVDLDRLGPLPPKPPAPKAPKSRRTRGAQCPPKRKKQQGVTVIECSILGSWPPVVRPPRPNVVGVGRFTSPDHLVGATDFAKDDLVNDATWFVKTLKATAWAYDPLKKALADLEANWARPREPGEWGLAFMGFTISRHPDVQPWLNSTTDAFWIACGFTGKPPYSRVYSRFTELEQVIDEFEACAARLIQQARRHEPRIGAHLHFDSTEAETHAALVHVCCPGKKGEVGRRPQRQATSVVRAERQEEADGPLPADPEAVYGDVEKVKIKKGKKYLKINGHWYRTRDATAGARGYKRRGKSIRFWHGHYSQKAIDHFTGAPVAVETHSASEAEYHAYPRVLGHAELNTGIRPETTIFDKGYSVSSVFELNTRAGIATIAPHRNAGTGRRHDKDTHDRHGIPRCKHCGGDSTFVRFSANREPRIWFHCRAELTPGCKKDQSISCFKDWRFLIPLWRTDPLYHELRGSHERYERVHHLWRERYRVGPDNRSLRPKRIGDAWQDLRAKAAMIAEWLRILFREGWLGSARRNPHSPGRYKKHGHLAARDLDRFRKRIGLGRPYGRRAYRLGFGKIEPPSRRARAGPAPPSPATP
jgi:hypothetical protein